MCGLMSASSSGNDDATMGVAGLRQYNKRPQFVELHCKLADVSNVTRSLQWFSVVLIVRKY